MSTFGKIFAAFLGLLVLLPGLCFLAFGIWWAGGWLSEAPDMYGFHRVAPTLLVVGAVLTAVAILIFLYLSKHGGQTPAAIKLRPIASLPFRELS